MKDQSLAEATALAVVKFIFENIVCHHSCPQVMIFDRDSENKMIVEVLCKRYNIKRIQISPYNVKMNGMIERGH